MEQQREMNFYDLCRAIASGIGKLFKALGRLLARMVRITFRKWWIVLIITVLCVAAALYYSRPDNRRYKVNAVVTLNGVPKDIIANEFNGLNNANYLFEGQTLSNILGVPPEVTWTLSRFKTFDVIDCLGDSVVDFIDYKGKVTRMDTNYVHMPYRLALQFCTSHPENVPAVEQALLQYLNSRPYIQKLYTTHLTDMQRRARFNHDQLEKLDSLTSVFYFSNNNLPQVELSAWQSGMILGSREIELFLDDIYNHIIVTEDIDQQLALCTAPVVPQSHFMASPRAVNGPLKCSCIAIILGWILGVLLADIVENRRNILTWLKQK